MHQKGAIERLATGHSKLTGFFAVICILQFHNNFLTLFEQVGCLHVSKTVVTIIMMDTTMYACRP